MFQFQFLRPHADVLTEQFCGLDRRAVLSFGSCRFARRLEVGQDCAPAPALAEARARLAVAMRTSEPDSFWDEPQRQQRQTLYAAAYAAMRPLHARLLDS